MASRIVFLSLFIYLSLAASGPPGDVAFAQQEFFPFLAEVTGDRVNVRSGQSANFERLCQIDKGEEIVVEGKEFSWYKVRLPSSAKSFVSKKYVQFLGQNAGGVIADRVNIRAGADPSGGPGGSAFTVTPWISSFPRHGGPYDAPSDVCGGAPILAG